MKGLTRTLICCGCVAILAGCGGSDQTKAKGDKAAAKGEPVSSVLVLDGKTVTEDGALASDAAPAGAKDADTPAAKRRTVVVDDEPQAPPLLADGSIDDGPDPFAGEMIPVQPIPIEDDPATTKAIDAWSRQLRRVDRAQWDEWMNYGLKSPWAQEEDRIMESIVKITVERCGGARTVATGVVLDEDTVVTTVHAVENAAKRVRVSAALRDQIRLPAMIRYLDVDDDIAVLKVPGLQMEPMLWHVVTDAVPHWGYAYGVGRGGMSGTMRRTPAVVAMQEATIDLEQPDGFAEEITDRSIVPMVGGIDAGFSGGVITATNDVTLRTLWGFHGLIRARVPFRADTAGIVVPARLVADALDANDRLDEWYEQRPGRGCPQWRR